MRYQQLLEFQAEPDDVAPAGAVKPVAPPRTTKVYFHVTTKHRLKAIQERGIEPNHPRRWKTGFGKQLGDRGNIYLMSDFAAAVHWAYKQQWEHYKGKEPDKSPYIIICVREDPKTLEPDPHPENGLYGNTWFQKKGSITPEDILKVIPLTPALVKQTVGNGGKVTEAWGHHYSVGKCMKALADKGWHETTVPMEFANPEYPEFTIDLDIDSIGEGPFTVFRGTRKLGTMKVPPFAQHLGLKHGLIDTPAQHPNHAESDFGF